MKYMKDFLAKAEYGFDDLVEIMTLLRSENGCPWDKEQNHKSIRNNFIEEAYEAVEAIDNDDPYLLKEELGDVLLQVVFHSRMSEEEGNFSINDVCDGICKKLIFRHPHIFSDAEASTSAEVLDRWDELKKIEKSQKTATDTLKAVAKSFPALVRSQKVQKRAAKVGFDWNSVDGAIQKIREETEELCSAIGNNDTDNIGEELGDLLFSCVNVARFVKCDAENCLYSSCEKFISRFEKMEQAANSLGKDLKEMTLEEMDELWNSVKHG